MVTTPSLATAARSLYYAGATAGISVTLNAGGSGTVTGDISVGTDTIIGGVNSIQGSNFNDTYNASTFSSPSGSFNQFLGNGGNDTITGNGNTQLYYGATTAGISATLNAGGTGTVTGDSSVGSDTINGGVNNIFGSNFNDTFTLNSPGANFQSTLTGNGGNDTFVFKPNFGKATITDFHSGQDTIDFDPTLFCGLQCGAKSYDGGGCQYGHYVRRGRYGYLGERRAR